MGGDHAIKAALSWWQLEMRASRLWRKGSAQWREVLAKEPLSGLYLDAAGGSAESLTMIGVRRNSFSSVQPLPNSLRLGRGRGMGKR